MARKRKKISKKELLFVTLGATILSFGVYNIHYQSGIAEGGELGLELLLKHFFAISPALTAFLFDLVFFIIGVFVMGNKYAFKAVLGTFVYSATYFLFEQFPPVLPNLSALPALACIIGAIFVGIGAGLVVKMGGSSGGDDTLALLLNKLTKLPIGACYFVFDFIIIVISLSYVSLENSIFSFITAALSSIIIGLIQKLKI